MPWPEITFFLSRPNLMILRAIFWLENFHGLLGFCWTKFLGPKESTEELGPVAFHQYLQAPLDPSCLTLSTPAANSAPSSRKLCSLCRSAFSHLVNICPCCKVYVNLKLSPSLLISPTHTPSSAHTAPYTPPATGDRHLLSSSHHHLPP